MAVRASVFGAVGTAGQRCTSLRRLVVHESIYDEVLERMVRAYETVPIGNPLESDTLMGPLHTASAIKEYTDGLAEIVAQGGKIVYGGKPLEGEGFFVQPTIVETHPDMDIVDTELFVPILHVHKFSTLDEAIAINNKVPQGLSSSIFTNDMKAMWRWLGYAYWGLHGCWCCNV